MLSWHNKTKHHGNMLYPNRIKSWVQFLKITGIGTLLDLLSESLNIIECNHMFQIVMPCWKNGYMWRPLPLGGNCLLLLSHLEYSVFFIKVTSFIYMHSYKQCIWWLASYIFKFHFNRMITCIVPSSSCVCVCVCVCVCMCVCGFVFVGGVCPSACLDLCLCMCIHVCVYVCMC